MHVPPVRPARILAGVFLLSGVASLVDQVAWQRALTLYLGAGATSTTLIVSVYMLGLGIGSLAGGHLADRARNRHVLYAGIQLTLAVVGVASVKAIAAIGSQAAVLPSPVLFSSFFAFLFVPTFLMGATLPLVATMATRATGDFDASVSRLYSVNTAGAAGGAVLAAYCLVPLLGLDGAVVAAALLDAGAGLAILAARPRTAVEDAPLPQRRPLPPPEVGSWFRKGIYLLAFATGFVAIADEMIWYRVIGVLVKDSPYAFASVLSVYLAGLACGSLWVHGLLRATPASLRPRLLFRLQCLVGLSVLVIFAGYYYLSQQALLSTLVRISFSADVHPAPGSLDQSGLRAFLASLFLRFDVFVWPLAFLFVPTVLMGAGFPLLASLARSCPDRDGTAVGRIACSTVAGNVVGGLVTGLALLPWLGTERTVLLLGCLGLQFGAWPSPGWSRRVAIGRTLAVASLVGAACIAFPGPGRLLAALHVPPFEPSTARVTEGRDAVVVTYWDGTRVRNFINGQGHGYRPGPFFTAETIEALSHVAAPARILIIGVGAGSVIEAALEAPGLQELTVVELSGSVIDNLRQVPPVAPLLRDPRARFVIDDGRRYLLRHRERFDAILMDPLRTSTANSNNLHSLEFFGIAAARLAGDGVLMVGGLDDGSVVARTLTDVFAHVRAYSGFCLASARPFREVPGRSAWLAGRVASTSADEIARFSAGYLA